MRLLCTTSLREPLGLGFFFVFFLTARILFMMEYFYTVICASTLLETDIHSESKQEGKFDV